ncbi:MAG: lactoylglutathione lyase [Ruminococcaceae bacterium]|nr:lactoylglutathione lyase [Oscillospiraceae bacterium]
MSFTFAHTNFNVANLEKSIAFYTQALGFKKVREIQPQDKSFTIVFMSDEKGTYQLELTCLADHPQPYDLGEGEFHLAVHTDDYDAAHEMHKKMGCICFENPAMGIYFISDPDGYWIEILRA